MLHFFLNNIVNSLIIIKIFIAKKQSTTVKFLVIVNKQSKYKQFNFLSNIFLSKYTILYYIIS